jgi:hypothetical protein
MDWWRGVQKFEGGRASFVLGRIDDADLTDFAQLLEQHSNRQIDTLALQLAA